MVIFSSKFQKPVPCETELRTLPAKDKNGAADAAVCHAARAEEELRRLPSAMLLQDVEIGD